MSIAAILIASFIALFAFSSISTTGHQPQNQTSQAWRPVTHAFEPPARKSIIVGSDGMAHRTADGTQMTRIDRGSPVRQKFVEKPPVVVRQETPPDREIVSPPLETPVPLLEKPPVVVRQETPPDREIVSSLPDTMVPVLTPTTLPEDSIITKDVYDEFQTAIMADPSLSYSARLSFRVITSADGKLIVQGLALDQNEKERIGAMVQRMAGTKTLDNQMTTVNE